MFLGLPNPDPLFRGTDLDPSLFLIKVELTASMLAKKNGNTKFISKAVD
jgi:hypothetical protein